MTEATQTVVLPELTPEQEALLRKRFQLEMGIGDVTQPTTPSEGADEFIYTNVTSGDLIIPDLGFKLPNDQFEPIVFKAGQTVNLRQTYKRREILASRYLIVALIQGLVVKGPGTPAQRKQTEDPLVIRAREYVGSSEAFADPYPLALNEGDGETEYDKKLAELRRKEIAENQSTHR